MSELPPYEMKGSVSPLVGRRPKTTAKLTSACAPTSVESPTAA